MSVSHSEEKYSDLLRSFLCRQVRVSTLDGRIFLGTFAGTDQPLNLVLVNTEEYRSSLDSNRGIISSCSTANFEGRYVGLVMIPWKRIRKVEIQRESQRKNRGGRREMEPMSTVQGPEKDGGRAGMDDILTGYF